MATGVAGGGTTGLDVGGVTGVAGVAGFAVGVEPGLPFAFAGGTAMGALPLSGSVLSASSGASGLPGACGASGVGTALGSASGSS